MSVSHILLPPLSRLDPAVAAEGAHAQRFPPALNLRTSNSLSEPPSLIRLPSYKELTSQCEADINSTLASSPPARRSPDARPSSLFTAGLIHLPPLNLPHGSAPSGSKQALSLSQSHTDRDRDFSPQRTPREDHWSAPTKQQRFLNLSTHCPASRIPSPYTDTGSVESTDSEGSRTRGGHGATMARPEYNWPPIPIPAYDPAHQQYPAHSNYYLPPVSLNMRLPAPHVDAQPAKLKFSHAKAGGRPKKQALSCFFCRERKIACGRPEPGATWEGGENGACNQCARRKIACTYPTVSHRGQHSRLKSAARKAQSVESDGGAPS